MPVMKEEHSITSPASLVSLHHMELLALWVPRVQALYPSNHYSKWSKYKQVQKQFFFECI